MHYIGGKAFIGRKIAAVIEGVRRGINKKRIFYKEPFVGAASVTQYVANPRVVYDMNSNLISMWNSVMSGWLPPRTISEKEYLELKESEESTVLRTFVGFDASFGGKWFGGYGRRAQKLTPRHIVKAQRQRLAGTTFEICDYRKLKMQGDLIYCDPPYGGKQLYGAVEKFDIEEFWVVMRRWIKNKNVILISEYEAPEDFVCVWKKLVRVKGLRRKLVVDSLIGKIKAPIFTSMKVHECIFMHKSQAHLAAKGIRRSLLD